MMATKTRAYLDGRTEEVTMTPELTPHGHGMPRDVARELSNATLV